MYFKTTVNLVTQAASFVPVATAYVVVCAS